MFADFAADYNDLFKSILHPHKDLMSRGRPSGKINPEMGSKDHKGFR